jgi:c-di-GMP-binding flagellar brake protein YcgR
VRPPRNANPLPTEGRDDEHRRHGRLRTELLRCRFGEVVDISASGMRVLVKGKCPLQQDMELGTELVCEDLKLMVKVRVAWVRKDGFRKHQVGMTFVDLTPSLEAAIRKLAQMTMCNRTPYFE